MRYLAIDIGASSGRHIVGYTEGGRIKLKEVYRFSNGAAEQSGTLVWGAERLFNEVVNGLKAARAQGFTPDVIGIDTWAVDYALLCGDKLVGDVVSYRAVRPSSATGVGHTAIPLESLCDGTGFQF